MIGWMGVGLGGVGDAVGRGGGRLALLGSGPLGGLELAYGQVLVGERHEGQVVVEPGVGPAFVVIESDVSFAFLVCSFDAPAQATEPHEVLERGVGRKVGQPRLRWRRRPRGSMQQQPTLGLQLIATNRSALEPLRRSHSNGREEAGLRALRADSPR